MIPSDRKQRTPALQSTYSASKKQRAESPQRTCDARASQPARPLSESAKGSPHIRLVVVTLQRRFKRLYPPTESARDQGHMTSGDRCRPRIFATWCNEPVKPRVFETAIIERYRRRDISVEEAIVQMYLAGVSVRRVEDVTEALWCTRVSSGTVSKLNPKVYKHIKRWRSQPIEGAFPYVFLGWLVGSADYRVFRAIGSDGCGNLEVAQFDPRLCCHRCGVPAAVGRCPGRSVGSAKPRFHRKLWPGELPPQRASWWLSAHAIPIAPVTICRVSFRSCRRYPLPTSASARGFAVHGILFVSIGQRSMGAWTRAPDWR